MAGRIDVYFVVGGRFHDFDFARLEPVAVSRNTFFWQAATTDVTRGDIKGLVVRWHNGRTFDVNLDFGDA